MNDAQKIKAWEQRYENAENRLTMTFQSIGENVATARLVAASFGSLLGFSMAEIEEIKVAVSEGVSNAMIHGYLNDPHRKIMMSLAKSTEDLFIIICDHGVGMVDVEQSMEPSYSTAKDHMGLGFVFMKTFMDDLLVISAPGYGTTLLMQKRPQVE